MAAHPVLWFEVLGRNGDELRAFYHQLFGWYIDADNPRRYGVVETGAARGITGGIGDLYDARTRPWVTFYVESPDITATLADVVRLGGRILMPRNELPSTTIGLFEDPEGHVVGLVEAPRPAHAARQPERAGAVASMLA